MSRRLPPEAILDFSRPAPEAPLTLLVLPDVSAFLEPGDAGPRFNKRYSESVDSVVLAGLRALAEHLEEGPGPAPPDH